MSEREVYVEIQTLGNSARVAAVDAATGEEVVFQVPIHTTRLEIDRLALAKLNWKLARNARTETGKGKKQRPGDKPGRGLKV
ncbi:hypothetical protein [Maricaulis sp.]|uniref:DUF6898 family protein n=1 Tax=Maricaulis sp. TaxID=1486257 RepID=UPI002613601D|nr:hypothetical protein [Maricaulis sp.]